MGIFKRRYLCLFAFLFMLSSLFSWFIPWNYSLILVFVFAALSIICFALSLFVHKYHVRLMTLFLCVFVIFISFLYSFFSVSIPRKYVSELDERMTVHCRIISKEQNYGGETEYHVKILRIGDEKVSIRGTLLLGFDSSLKAYDEIYGLSLIEEEGDPYALSDGRIVYLYMNDSEKCYFRPTSEAKKGLSLLFTDIGAEVLSDRLSDTISSFLISSFGDEIGSLASGFFTGDRDEIPTNVTRDFRRSGVSHLMAVSGSHIAILLGSVEILLRKLKVDKKIRCTAVILIGIAFLFATGFAPSAIRSALMLLFVYISFFIYEENDSLTSLFVSISVILIIFPFAVVDLGLWMSFIATLGLLTAYPVFEQRIPYPRKLKQPLKGTVLVFRETLLIALMTIISNAYLLPISWYFFGELSLVSVPCNIVLSPLSTVFMISIPIYIAVSAIPVIGNIIGSFLEFVGEIILFTVRFCSGLDTAVISLRYGFCAVIVVAFTISMIVFLIIELKRKYLIAMPSVISAVAFTVCILFSEIFLSAPKLTYINDSDSNEIISIKEGSEISFCDNSGGTSYLYRRIKEEMDLTYATEIDSYILTHYHESHIALMKKLLNTEVVRRIVLPLPNNDEEHDISLAIKVIAEKNGTETVFYRVGSGIQMTDSVAMCVTRERYEEGIEVTFASDGSQILYTSSGRYSPNEDYKVTIIGGHDAEDSPINLVGISTDHILVHSKNGIDRIENTDKSGFFLPKVIGNLYKATYLI